RQGQQRQAGRALHPAHPRGRFEEQREEHRASGWLLEGLAGLHRDLRGRVQGRPASVSLEPASVTATPLLQLSGVSKRFGAVQALSQVDFEAYPGEVVALV